MPNINQYNDNGFISNIKILDKSTCNVTNNYENFFNKILLLIVANML